MKAITLLQILENKMVKRQEFTRHESGIYTLLIKLTGDKAEFSIECSGEDDVMRFGTTTDDSNISLNQPVPLEKEGSNVLLSSLNPGVHFFQLDMSDESKPLLRVKADLEDAPSAGRGLDHFLNSKLPVSMEIGRTWMNIEDVLSLGQGTIIELDRLVGEALHIYIGETLVAKAEVVIAKDQFGARLTSVLPVAKEMVKDLNLLAGDVL